jgi:hypothetical protein
MYPTENLSLIPWASDDLQGDVFALRRPMIDVDLVPLCVRRQVEIPWFGHEIVAKFRSLFMTGECTHHNESLAFAVAVRYNEPNLRYGLAHVIL